jgi:hypothetical protein
MVGISLHSNTSILKFAKVISLATKAGIPISVQYWLNFFEELSTGIIFLIHL